MTNYTYYNTPLGKVTIAEDGVGVCALYFGRRPEPKCWRRGDTPLLRIAVVQLAEYFAGKRRAFDLPLSLSGTAFQLADWAALRIIPYGETRSYGQIAAQLGNEKAARAVGMANNRNPVAIIVPCHRVVGKNGSLTGYAGGLHIKKALLDLEAANM